MFEYGDNFQYIYNTRIKGFIVFVENFMSIIWSIKHSITNSLLYLILSPSTCTHECLLDGLSHTQNIDGQSFHDNDAFYILFDEFLLYQIPRYRSIFQWIATIVVVGICSRERNIQIKKPGYQFHFSGFVGKGHWKIL